MPNNIRMMLSILTLIVGAAAFIFERQDGNDDLAWVVAGLTVFMTLAIWMFPEARKKSGSKS